MARQRVASFCHPRIHAAVQACLALMLAALAGGAGADGMGGVLKYGEADRDYERIGIGLRWGPFWSADWGRWRTTLRPELELSHFRYTGTAGGPGSLNQAGGIGFVRLQYAEGRVRPYAEAGLGAALFSRDTLGRKAFSTHFQFSQHLGLGVMLSDTAFTGWQYSHYSNADIDTPNDGIDMHQLVLGMHF